MVRKTVNEASAPEAEPEPAPAAEPEPEPVAAPEPPRAEEPAAPKAKETSDWFAPRKSPAPAPTPAPDPTPAPSPKRTAPGPDAPGTGFAGSATSGVPTVGSAPSSRPVTPPSGPVPGNPLYETGTPAGGTPVYEGAPAGGTPLHDGTPAGGVPAYDGTPAGGTPLYDGTPAGGTPLYEGTPAGGTPPYDGTPAGGTPVQGGPAAPSGPTTGPMSGIASLGGPGGQGPFRGQGGQGRGPAGQQGQGPVGGQGRGPMGQQGQGPVGQGPAGQGAGAQYPGGTPRMSDDTAVLTPQQPAPASGRGPGRSGGPAAEGAGHVSGDTLTSGIPVVPPAKARPDLAPRVEERPAPAPAARQAPAKKKGRSKLVLLGAGVLGLVGVAYGAGLLLNHSDVPKGTTVLGVDIGGGTKEEAVNKLEAALGKRAHAPLQLSVAGKKVQLPPDKAGLSLDSQETVRNAAGSDYNPVSVIGSLFGGERVAKPVFPVDEEKLAVALTDLAGASGSATEGTILFAPNKVTPVEGKPGKGLDVRRSVYSVRDAFRAQVETGQTKVVELPVTSRRPMVTKAELDRAMKEFAEPAMSDRITIRAGGKEIQFGPARSLPQILSMKAVNGRLVEVYDKKAIERLLDGAFDGVMITKGDGAKHEVSADDVAFVMRDALLGKTPAERTKTIDLSGEG
uniref:hypothetical protein n=1 Tax=Streptomyces bikiniensis TaxID=1896 RepID=UPI001F28816C|nr:hypothetical protein [Streptomyces bikiniensis]